MMRNELSGSGGPVPRAGSGVLERFSGLLRPASGTSVTPYPSILWRPNDGPRVMHRLTSVVAAFQEVLRGTREHVRDAPGAYGFLIGRAEKALFGGQCTIVEGWWEVPDGDLRKANVQDFREAWIEAGSVASSQGLMLAGWYHGHGLLGCSLSDRGVGCTLSERDIALHRSFFRHDWQCSLVVIPHERFPAGAFVIGDPGNRHQAANPVPFLELLDEGPDPTTGVVRSAVDWTNYTRERAVSGSGQSIRSVVIVPPADDGNEAESTGQAVDEVGLHDRPRTFQLGKEAHNLRWPQNLRTPIEEEPSAEVREKDSADGHAPPEEAQSADAPELAEGESVSLEPESLEPESLEPETLELETLEPESPGPEPEEEVVRSEAGSAGAAEFFEQELDADVWTAAYQASSAWMEEILEAGSVFGAFDESTEPAASAAPAEGAQDLDHSATAEDVTLSASAARPSASAREEADREEGSEEALVSDVIPTDASDPVPPDGANGAADGPSDRPPPNGGWPSSDDPYGATRPGWHAAAQGQRSGGYPAHPGLRMATRRHPPPYPAPPTSAFSDAGWWPQPHAPPPASDDPGVSDLAAYLQVIRERKTTVLSILAVVFLGVTLGSLLQTPMYRAEGTVEIRKQGGEVMPVEALFQPDNVSSEYLETQYGILESRSLARRVVRDLGFIVGNPPPEATPAEMAGATEQEVDRFGSRLIIDPSRGSRLVDVYFEHEDPEVAAAAVNGVITSYIDMRVEAGREAGARLAKQVDSVRSQLTASEAELQSYMREHDLVMLSNADGSTDNIVSRRLDAIQQEITEAEADRYEKESRYNLVQRGEFGLLDSSVLQQLQVRIADLRAEYARLRATFTDEYPRTRQVKGQLDELESLYGRERSRIASEIRNDYEAAVQRQELLTTAFEGQRELLDRLAQASSEYNRLKRDLDAHQELYSILQQHRQEAGVSAALASNDIAVVDLAVSPQDPFKPTPKKNAALGLIIGLILGIAGAFLRELTDDSVRTVEEIGTLADVPVLAAIPSAPLAEQRRLSTGTLGALRNRRRGEAPIEDGDAPSWYRIDRDNARQSALSEAFGGLRTSVLVSRPEGPPQVILLTSAQPREGKTTVSVNLSLSLARLGRRVLLVDADTRRPAVHRALALKAGPGLVDCLRRRADWRGHVHRDVAPGLDVLIAGAPPDSPSELLASEGMARLIHEARREYDFVLVDSPALLVNVPDTRIVAPLVDGVVLVMRSGVTPRESAKRLLQEVPNPIGVVLNDLSGDHLPGYYRMEEEQTAV